MSDESTTPDFTAVYLPMLPDGAEDPTESGFPTEEAAWDYVFEGMCQECTEKRARYLANPEDEQGDQFPACACEWAVVPTDKLAECEDVEDVLGAAGYEAIYRRGEATE